MKKVFFLFIGFVFSGFLSLGQAPEKANTIVLTMSDSIGLNDKVMKVLKSRGYTSSSAKNATTIITTARTLKNGARVQYTFKLKGNEITLTGILPIAGQPPRPIANQGNKGTPVFNGWEEMDKIAKEFGVKIKYEVR